MDGALRPGHARPEALARSVRADRRCCGLERRRPGADARALRPTSGNAALRATSALAFFRVGTQGDRAACRPAYTKARTQRPWRQPVASRRRRVRTHAPRTCRRAGRGGVGVACWRPRSLGERRLRRRGCAILVPAAWLRWRMLDTRRASRPLMLYHALLGAAIAAGVLAASRR